jgi:hypothetical protein
VPVSGHDKELFFRKWGEISGLGVYPSLCELVEGIVTVPLVGLEVQMTHKSFDVILPISKFPFN